MSIKSKILESSKNRGLGFAIVVTGAGQQKQHVPEGGEAINMGSSGIVGFVSACRCGLDGRCLTKNSVYKITCNLCNSTGISEYYIGESKRPIRYRFNEHLWDARLRRMDTPLGEHIPNSHTDISNADVNNAFHIEILTRAALGGGG